MDPPTSPHEWNRRILAAAALGLAVGVAAVFLAPADLLPGSARADLGQQFLAWRAFAAQSLRHGHLPLWNPYSYGGEPFLGGFQSAVFYPPNLLFLFLPLGRAVNLSLLLHGLILAAGLYRWARLRDLHPLAAAAGAGALTFSGPVFPHVYAGHLPNLCTLAWAPWILGSLEAWYRRGRPRGLAWACAAAAMQVLAGQVQYVFGTALAAVFLAAALPLTGTRAAPGPGRPAVPRLRPWLRAGLALAGLAAGAAALAAMQLLPGWAAAAEGLRQNSLDPAFAGQFSLPPENLLTSLAPGFFGDPVRHLYWGRCYPWEMSVFLGPGAMLLILIALADPAQRRGAGVCLALAAPLLLLALGRHTPLFQPLYEHVPAFDRFRGWSKFDFPAFLFLSLAVAHGADALGRFGGSGARHPTLATAALLCGAALLGLGVWLAVRPGSVAAWIAAIRLTGESYLPAAAFARASAVQAAGMQAGQSLALAGGALVLAGGCLALALRRPFFRWGILALLAAESAGFASTQWATFRESDAVPPELSAFVGAHPGDYRVQNLLGPDNGFLIGAPDLWGNDPALLRRYAELIAFSQGLDPDRASQNVDFRSPSPLDRLLRLRYIFTRTGAGLKVYEMPAPLARVQLLSDYRVLPDRRRLFAAMSQPDFDPARTVLLEQEPEPRPSPAGRGGSVRVTADSPDAFEVEADLASPSLLLVTDAYSRDWRARPLPGSGQAKYEVLPADYAVRATPLAAGHHRIRFEYFPRGLRLGLAISGAAWLCWLGLILVRRAPAISEP